MSDRRPRFRKRIEFVGPGSRLGGESSTLAWKPWPAILLVAGHLWPSFTYCSYFAGIAGLGLAMTARMTPQR